MPVIECILAATRLDWFNMGAGLGSNKTGALIVMLLIGTWALVQGRSKYFIGAGLFCAAALAYCLLLTQSRGALVALFVAAGIILYYVPYKVSRKTLAVAGAIALCFLVVGLITGHADRYFLGIGDGSIQARFKLWDAGIDMLADAPGGWGLGHAGDAFMQWYQPYHDEEHYITLVNTPLTRLVELPWYARILYLILYSGVLAVCWPRQRNPFFIAALATWVSFLVCGLFNPMDDLWILWVLPLFYLAGAFVYRIRFSLWSVAHTFKVLSCVGLVALALLHLFAYMREKPVPITGSADRVLVGESSPRFTVYDPDKLVLSWQYGHDIRRDINGLVGVEVVYRPEAGGCAEILVLSGRNLDYPTNWMPQRVILFNPESKSLERLLETRKLNEVSLYTGYYLDWRHLYGIEKLAEEYSIPLFIHSGVGKYYQDWTRVLIEVQQDSTNKKGFSFLKPF